MYCPNCGKENSEPQRFCRSCGIGLQGIAIATSREVNPSEKNLANLLIREYRGWQNPLVYGLFMLVLGLVITVIGKKTFDDKTVADIGTVTALMGTLLIVVKGLLLMNSQSKQQQSRSSAAPQRELDSSSHPRALTAEPRSVTENTTKHFDAVPAERSRDTQPT